MRASQGQSLASLKREFEHLARAYLRLIEEAERNSHFEIAYETLPHGGQPSKHN